MIKNSFKILILLLIFGLSFTLISCGHSQETPYIPDVDLDDDQDDDDDGGNTNPPVTNTTEFKVSLIYNKKIYIPEEEVTVIWSDGTSQYSAVIDEQGYAKQQLDGDYTIYLDGLSDDYTYNPNIYTATNDIPVVEIDLLKISQTRRGNGTGLYNEYKLSNTGTFRTTIERRNQKVYYEYSPNKAGYYVVESIVNTYDDVVNPKLDIYIGTTAAKFFHDSVNEGGASTKGGYTKNFKWVVKLAEQEIGNVYTFAVYADSKTGIYPINVDFSITYAGEHYLDLTVSTLMTAYEANFKTDEYSKEYTYYNADGGTGSYYNGTTNGDPVLKASNFKYNEEDGYWHVFNLNKYPETDGYGPILCAAITSPCAYYEEALSRIESHGNKDLTVSNGTENYKQFIEIDYAAASNSDGVCYVTKELQEFLQKFSVSQRLFFDGNGFVELAGTYAIEEDQWLFACGYYEKY